MTRPDGGAPALEVSDVVAGYGGGDANAAGPKAMSE